MEQDKLPSFQFYPADWRKDPGVQSLSFADRGVWIEILCLMHESPRRGVLLLPNGSIMTNAALSRILGISTPNLIKILNRISLSGVSSREEETGALINRRMVRDQALLVQRREWGRLGAEHGVKGGRPLKSPQGIPVSKKPLTGDLKNPPSSSSSSSSSEESNIQDSSYISIRTNPESPKPKQVGRPRDLAMDHFTGKCFEFTGGPYVIERGDAVMLAKLRKAFEPPVAALECPPGWHEAVENYFASALSQYSMADLSNPKRYAVFKNSPIDGYGKPINHQNRGNGNGQSREDPNTRAMQTYLDRVLAEDIQPELPDVRKKP